MADLIAQGEAPLERWRRKLPTGEALLLGRTSTWSVEWDDRISRQHVRLQWNGQTLQIESLPEARNPVFYRGEPIQQCELLPGQHFVIGRTSFTIVDEQVAVAEDLPEPQQEQAFSAQYLQRLRFRRPDLRIEYLNRLPELITSAATDLELYQRLGNVLLSSVPVADAVAIVSINQQENEAVRIRHWDRRSMIGSDFRPSERLIRATLARGETLLHVWQSADHPGYTMSENCDWACCLPVPGSACQGWVIYLAGRLQKQSPTGGLSDPWDLRDDLKFGEIVAATLGSLRELRLLNKRQASLAPFFSPRVRDALKSEDPDLVLAPRETDVTVLFCDLRGFSSKSEAQANALFALLSRVSEALGVMSRQILANGGVLADFQGDAAMGFWGWPIAQPQYVIQAVAAALAIRAEFSAAAEFPEHPLHDFRVGIGLASGRAVAGKIGTADQVQVTVFGPVPNLAQRLEALTRRMQAEILLDAATATIIAPWVTEQQLQLRRLAKVRPKGLQQPIDVFELRMPVDPATTEQLANYEMALSLIETGIGMPRKRFSLPYQSRCPACNSGASTLQITNSLHHKIGKEL